MKSVIAVIIMAMVPRQIIAQVDSNSIASIRLSKLCGSCGLEIQTLPIEDTMWTAPYVLSQESLCISLDTTFKISKLPEDIFGLSINFKIDSTYNCFRNILIQRHELDHIPWNGGVGTLDVMNGLEVYFDSLPFKTAAGHLIGKGKALYQSMFTSSLLTMAILHTQFRGGCSTSDSGLDSIVIDIAPSILLPSIVSSSRLTSFQVHAVGRNFFFEFPESNIERTLYIYDIMGREIDMLYIRSGTNRFQTPLQLSPGQYFVRLSSETIRVIVYPF